MNILEGRSRLCGVVGIILALLAGSLSHAADEAQMKAAIRSLYDQIRPLISFSETEQAALSKRGQVAVYLPMGANDRGLISQLKQMQLEPLCIFVNDQAISSGVLAGKSLLILPDLCEYEPQSGRDDKIKDYLAKGGGVYALGSAIRHLHGLGLFEAELISFRARGGVRSSLDYRAYGQTKQLPIILGQAAPILKKALDEKVLRDNDIYITGGITWDGPLFQLPAGSPLRVVVFMGLSGPPGVAFPTVPGVAYGAVGKGRLVILSGGQTGLSAWGAPIDATQTAPVEPNADDITNLVQPIVNKQLIAYASGDPMSPLAATEVGK